MFVIYDDYVAYLGEYAIHYTKSPVYLLRVGTLILLFVIFYFK
jgi:hypothetical protein